VRQAILPAGGLSGRLLLDFGHLSREVEKPSGAGFQPAAGFSPPSWYATNFSGFVSLKRCAAKPEKFLKIRGSRLKAGCSLKGRPQKAKAELQAACSIRTNFSGFVV